jgi:hypothetical protein
MLDVHPIEGSEFLQQRKHDSRLLLTNLLQIIIVKPFLQQSHTTQMISELYRAHVLHISLDADVHR